MIKFIAKRKILIGLATVLILLLGSYGLSKLDEELLPDVKFDGAYVTIYAGDMAAAEVERKVTTPIEQAIQGIENVEDIYSTTTIGLSNIQVMIEKDQGEETSQEIASIVHSITSNVPEVNDVIAEQFSTGATYEFYMDVSGGTMDEINAFAKEVLEPRLESLPEVRDVLLVGMQENELMIELNREAIQQHQLSTQEIIATIQQANSNATLGNLSEEEGQPTLRWQSQIENVSDIENIQIPIETGFIPLKELADVSIKPMQNSSFVWKDGAQNFVLAQVGRNSDFTQIDMAAAVREELKKIKEDGLHGDLVTNEIVAQADYVEDSIKGITDNVLIGGLLAILVLFFF